MGEDNKIQLFENQPIRTAWNEELEEWYFSIIDVIAVLTESKDANAYWRKLKQRLIKEGNETVTNCHALKMKAADGKRRLTDVASTEQIYLPYVKLILTSPIVTNQLEKKKQGVAQLNLSLKDINEILMPLPSKKQQIELADLFKKVADVIYKRNAELLSLDNLIKARFVEMFGDIILNDKGWKTDTWSNALKIVNGKNQKAVESDDGEYLICGSGGAMGRATEYLTNENSVIIGRKGSINKPLLMREKYWNVDTAFGIEPNRKYINVDYLYMFCVFFNFEQLNKAVTIPSLTKADLLNIEMPIPNILLQEQFADFVHQVDKSKFMKSF